MKFVLIPGSWMGPWVWEPVTRGLRELGHQVYPVSLAGLDGASFDISRIDLETHIGDVTAVLEREDLRDAIVVGHTGTGALAGVVADRVPDRVAHTVLVETFLPHDGRSLLEAFPEPLRADEERLIADHAGRWPIPDVTVVADGQDLTFEQAKWLVERFVPHPGRALTDPVGMRRPISEQRVTYVVCKQEHFGDNIAADVDEMGKLANWDLRTLDSGLWPMVSVPRDLVALLDDVARGG